jgi:ParB-like chromosome segregation protein Spo0J
LAEYEVHPAADLFPLMVGEELQALADDIKANGLRQPIVLDTDDRVLDGRNRLAACKLAKVEPTFETAEGDPLALVISLNVNRRHLTTGQRAIAAAEAWELVSPRTSKRAIADRHKTLGVMFGVSATSVQRARALVERDPALAAVVKNGGGLKPAYEALTEREEVLERLQTMTDETASLETLPGPGVKPITDAEKEAARQRMDKQRDEEGLKQWEAVLAACNTASKAVRDDLPPFPEGPEEELLRLAAREQARLLEDAAARLAQETDQATTLRRVK